METATRRLRRRTKKEKLGSLEKMVATELLKLHGDGQRKKSKTEEDGSYHSTEVSP